MLSCISSENNKRKNDVQIQIFSNRFSRVTESGDLNVGAGCDAGVVDFGGLDGGAGVCSTI